MKISTLLVGAFGGIVLFTSVLPRVLSLIIAGKLLIGGLGAGAWLFAVRLTGVLIDSTFPGRGRL